MIDRLTLFWIYFLLFMGSASATLPLKSAYRIRNDIKYPEVKCGKDLSGSKIIREGEANIETYPWFGFLVYPLKGVITAAPVVLITKQLVIGAALEIANYPKIDFRARSKVVLGTNCTGPRIKVKEYTYHPDFLKNTYSSFVLIQLDVIVGLQALKPICPPPDKVFEANFYAVTLGDDYMSSKINIFRMTYVDPQECKIFYRRSELDIDSMWPKYTVCAKALRGGSCLWGSGVFLVMKKDDHWMLAGFGVPGPGCESPSRYLEYGMYHQWVRNTIERIGRPAITRIAQNNIVVRRRTSSVQRFGPCDAEEKYIEIYSDHTAIYPGTTKPTQAIYNFTILAQYEYSCIIFSASQPISVDPTISLRRLCLASKPSCYQVSTLQIDFEIVIHYMGEAEYHVNVFGESIRILDTKRMSVYFSRNTPYPNITQEFIPARGWSN